MAAAHQEDEAYDLITLTEKPMENIYKNYRAKQIGDVWWVVGEDTKGEAKELKVVKVPHWIRHQKGVAEAVAAALNTNKKIKLVDLI